MSNYRMLIMFFILPGALWAIGSFTLQRVDRLEVNTEAKISVLSPMDIQERFTVTTTGEASIPCPVMTIIQRDALTATSGDCVFNDDDDELNIYDGLAWVAAGGTGGGDVVGPASSTDNSLPRFDGTTGKLIQGSSVVIDDTDNLTGAASITSSGAISGDTLAATTSVAGGNLIVSGNSISSTDLNGNINLSPDGTGVVGVSNLNINSSNTVNEISTDGTLAGDSDSAIPTEKAVKAYVDANSGAIGGVCVITDQKSSGTNGGSASASTWNPRILNTASGDCSFVTLSNGTTGTDGTANYWSLDAGKYSISCTAPAYYALGSQLRIMQDPGGSPTTLANGNSRYGFNDSSSTDVLNEVSIASVTIGSTTTYQLQHWITSVSGAGTASLGVDSGSGVSRYFGRCTITKY